MERKWGFQVTRSGNPASVSVSVANSSLVGGVGDTPEIRKYKKKFNSEVLCAALWGVNLLIGTDSGLMLLDRSGQGKGILFIYAEAHVLAYWYIREIFRLIEKRWQVQIAHCWA